MALFHYVQLRAFAHETEDPTKVKAAMVNAAHDAKASVAETRAEGTYGNRILILEADVKSAPAAKQLFGALARDDPRGFAHIVSTARDRLDENLNFHMRLDKQEAYGGRVVLATDDARDRGRGLAETQRFGVDAITVRGKIRSFESKRSAAGLESSLQQLEAFLSGFSAPALGRTVKREHSSHGEQSE